MIILYFVIICQFVFEHLESKGHLSPFLGKLGSDSPLLGGAVNYFSFITRFCSPPRGDSLVVLAAVVVVAGVAAALH